MTKVLPGVGVRPPKCKVNSSRLLKFDLDSYKDKTYLTHNFHPYPAKFIPQIPRIAIETLSQEGDIVLDPFCGSGTTLVEANILGRNAIGIDLNPIATLISRVKTCAISSSSVKTVIAFQQEVNSILLQIQAGAATAEIASELGTIVPNFLNRDHWFQNNMQLELAIIKTKIAKLKNNEARRFCFAAMSSIIVKVSNQDSETRWVAVDKELSDGTALRAYVLKLGDMVDRILKFSDAVSGWTKVLNQSVDKELPIKSSSIDYVVTSPPYMNSFDYYLYHKLRFYWLGYDHYQVQDAEIGSRNKHCDQALGIDSYVANMSVAIAEIQRVLKPKGYLTFIIGDSIYQGKLVNMSDIYRRLGKIQGLTLADVWSYDQRKYTTSFTPGLKRLHKETHVISFQKK